MDDGADALAMAGGDGSQAIVAMIAAELDLPYACIPAGTRNHFALDLGVDRDDVVGALDAFVNGGERRVDLAEVNGRVFVNNVSLGLYAEAVQQPGYREAKLHTLLETVPDALGPDAEPPDLHWDSPDRRAVCGRRSSSPTTRIASVGRSGRARGRGSIGRSSASRCSLRPSPARRRRSQQRSSGCSSGSRPTFEIASGSPVAAGIDGEAMRLDPPLRFRIRPGALRVRIAPHHPGASPSALEPDKARWQTDCTRGAADDAG